MQEFNYKEEVKKLQDKKDMEWFRPQAGQYGIIILEEPTKQLKTFEKKVDGEIVKEEVEQARLTIEINKKQFLWDISLGQTASSLFGQLMLIAQENNSLAGQKVTLIVKRSKDKNDYTIIEAVPLMNQKEKL